MRASAPVRVALVGCGAVARAYYAPAIRLLCAEGAADLVELVDPDPAAVCALQERFPAARGRQSLDPRRADAIDLAIVASPPPFHASQTIDLLRHGVSVLCEKPMATTSAEAESMVAEAEAAGRVLAVGLIRRFLPGARTIRAIVAQGALGELRRLRATEGGRFRWPTRSPGYFQPDTAGGGVLADIGSHLLDLIGWWLGEPSDLRYEDDAMGGVEANASITLRYRAFDALVRISRDVNLPPRCFIEGSRGWLSWSTDEPENLTMHLEGSGTALVGRLHESVAGPRGPKAGPRVANFERSFVAQLRNVLAAVRGADVVAVSGRDALRGVKLVERCYQTRRLMNMGWLGEREAERASRLSGEARAC